MMRSLTKADYDDAHERNSALRREWNKHRVIGEPVFKPPKRLRYAPDATHKVCTGCKKVRPLDAFNSLPTGALGRTSRCKDCVNAAGLAYTKRTRELRATRPRPEHCEACGKHPGKRALHWDHCHKSGAFRGWLCSACNTTLGYVDDSIERLQALIRYLERQKVSARDRLANALSSCKPRLA